MSSPRLPTHKIGREAPDEVLTVLVGRLEPLLLLGLESAFGRVHGVRLLASGLRGVILDRALGQHMPRLLILGEETPSTLLARLKVDHPATQVIVLVRDPPPICGTLLLDAGACCIAANVSAADLASALKLAADGDRVFLASDGHRLQQPSSRRVRSLTKREAEVFEQLRKEASDVEMARHFKLSIATVRTHMRAVRRKLGVVNRRELGDMPHGD
jgi:DNA-binding NarL/FixJ family response regulator